MWCGCGDGQSGRLAVGQLSSGNKVSRSVAGGRLGGGKMGIRVQSFRELDVYRASFKMQQMIFQLSKAWPTEEKYALTDQVRRSSRSIGGNIAEAWAKRRYPAHFLSKCTDADGELQETRYWLDTAVTCEYLKSEEHEAVMAQLLEVGRMLGGVIQQHESFCEPPHCPTA